VRSPFSIIFNGQSLKSSFLSRNHEKPKNSTKSFLLFTFRVFVIDIICFCNRHTAKKSICFTGPQVDTGVI